MTRAYLGLGGNLGDPAALVGQALRHLDARTDTSIVGVSRLFRTPPWGKTDQPWFVNACAAIETSLAPEGLLKMCLEIERGLKRERIERWGPRTVDLDILEFGGVRLSLPDLDLPHPRLTERAFVLVPLADIAPGLAIDGATIREWADRVERAGVEPLGPSRDWWRSA